jgi:hypothetical protein
MVLGVGMVSQAGVDSEAAVVSEVAMDLGGHHLRGGFSRIGVPYYSYDDEGCGQSRRYHRWVC